MIFLISIKSIIVSLSLPMARARAFPERQKVDLPRNLL